MNKTTLLCLLLLISCSKPIAETGAVLAVLSQGVTVNGNTPTVGMALNVGDVIATAPGAEAAIEFYNGSIVRLRENTTITIKKLTTNKDVVLTQEKGQTWNRVTKLAGINTYAVETPNSVATVRGTGFKVTVDAERTWIGVADGAVQVQRVEDDIVVAETLVEEDKQAEIFFETHEDIILEKLETDEWFEENIELDEQYVEEAYTDAGEDVPPEYLEEFTEHALETTSEILNESDEHANAAEETLEHAEKVLNETNEEPAITDTSPEHTDELIQTPIDETLIEKHDETPPIDTPDEVATEPSPDETKPEQEEQHSSDLVVTV